MKRSRNKVIDYCNRPRWSGILTILSNDDAKALSEILVRSASVKRKASKGTVRLTKRLFSTCSEICETKKRKSD